MCVFQCKIYFRIFETFKLAKKVLTTERLGVENCVAWKKIASQKMFLLKTILLFGISLQLAMCALIGEKAATEEKEELPKCKNNEDLLKLNETTESAFISVKTGDSVSLKQLPKCRGDEQLTVLTVDDITEQTIPFICSSMVLEGKDNMRCISGKEGEFYCGQIVLRRCFGTHELLHRMAHDSYLLHIGRDDIDTKKCRQ